MQTKTVITTITIAALTGCGSLPQDRAVSGGALGAGAGAALGAVTGMSVATGALVGAAAGALTGALTDQHQMNFGEPIWRRGGRPAPMTQIATPHAGSYSQVVNSIQTGLNRLGYRAGPVDGIVGSRTQIAIRAYQRDHSLLEDGRATPQLADHVWSRGRPRQANPTG
ncbi:MAG: peptidoglycan-binding protein [Gammaproteobacteria bacterium]|nr:peptidoglycan-binding protein [Gammaproteobacteria bacterium]